MFRRIDLVDYYDIERQDEPIFWCKLDLLIEVLSRGKKDEFNKFIKDSWNDVLPDKAYYYGVSQYIKQYKLPFKVMVEEGIDGIRKDIFVERMLLSLIFKYVITQNDILDKNELKQKVEEYAQKMNIEIENLSGEIQNIYNDYFRFAYLYGEAKLIFSPYKEDIYNLITIIHENSCVRKGITNYTLELA